ncbi:MAG TPA: 2OG-Fe(II) oxygenase [Rhizomicrobium sp.]|nr:2OG-Fe(II) oxygenase [Rhizomicrobium sp.]
MEDAPQLLPEAAEAYSMALKAAEGDGVPQNWPAALDCLEQAAQLGSVLACAQLMGLSGEWRLAHDILAGKNKQEWSWQQLRKSIDLEMWLKPSPTPIPATVSRMAVAKDIAEPELCDWLIARARPKLNSAKVYHRIEHKGYHSDKRTNSSYAFAGSDRDVILAILRARIIEVTGTHGRRLERPHILHYLVGQEFRPHFDVILEPNSTDYAERFAAGGERAMTFLLSLNDDYEGGETAFPMLDMRWRGRKGSAIFFWNVLPDGVHDRRMLHAGLPLTGGEKWMLTQWIRSREQS